MTDIRSRRRWRLPLVLTFLAFVGAPAHAAPDVPWRERLQTSLSQIDTQQHVRVGVFVRALDTGVAASHGADQRWYLASMVKLPVAITVLRGVERGGYTLAAPITLRAADYVDGAGPTNLQSVGQSLTVGELLERMIIHSDNTATDMLIDFVGLAEVNALAQAELPDGIGRITSLADVRRHVYAELTPKAAQLEGRDLMLLRQQPSDADRMDLLARLLHTPVHQFKLPTLRGAYEAYYAGGLNSGRLDAYGRLLERLVDGALLSPDHTAYLLETMERVQTGPKRLKAGLPATARFAHKTGTQRERICDAGIVRADAERPSERGRVVVVACVAGEPSLARAEKTLAAVGAAVTRSGVLSEGVR